MSISEGIDRYQRIIMDHNDILFRDVGESWRTEIGHVYGITDAIFEK